MSVYAFSDLHSQYDLWQRLPHNKIYEDKMDAIYLTICFYNLYEKYLCRGISQNDWWMIPLAYDEAYDSLKERI